MTFPRRFFLAGCGVCVTILTGCFRPQPTNIALPTLEALFQDASDDLHLIGSLLGFAEKSWQKYPGVDKDRGSIEKSTFSNPNDATTLKKNLEIAQETRMQHYIYLKDQVGNFTPLSPHQVQENFSSVTVPSTDSTSHHNYLISSIRQSLLQSGSHAQKLALHATGKVSGTAASIGACCIALAEVFFDEQ